MRRIISFALGVLFASLIATSVHSQEITVSFEGIGFFQTFPPPPSSGFFYGSYTLPADGGVIVPTQVPDATGYEPLIDPALSTLTIDGIGTSEVFPGAPVNVSVRGGSTQPDVWVFSGGAYIFLTEGFGCFLQATGFNALPNNEYFVLTSLDDLPDALLFCFGPPPLNELVFIGFIDTLQCDSGCLTANAGPDQHTECTSPAEELVRLDGSDSDAPADALYTWTEPTTGQEVTGVMADMQLPLGSFEVTLTVAVENLSDTDTVAITVQDTSPPLVVADMVQAGQSGHKYDIVATASDVCDPAPTVEATVGSNVSNGGSITIAQPNQEGLVRIMSSMVELKVTATDASGNSATESASP